MSTLVDFGSHNIESTSPEIKRNEINIDDLEGRVCYFSLFGNLSLKAYAKIKLSKIPKNQQHDKLKQHVKDRLYFALLMFDKVVVHCSDPLRSPLVLEILEENIDFVKSERIVFIVSSHITNYSTDYKNYINKKIEEYENGYYSREEGESLRGGHINDKYYERVIEVLEQSPIMIRKSRKPNNTFKELVLDDLVKNYNEIVDASRDYSFILSTNLSLKQLLTAQSYINDDKQKVKSGYGKMIFPSDLVDKITENISESLDQDVIIARTAIEDFFKQGLNPKKLTTSQTKLLDVISMRMDILYCLMNCGNQLLLEFHPYYEQKSLYRMDCFFEFLRQILGFDSKHKVNFEHDMIDKILFSGEVEALRLCYLSIMADTHEQMNFQYIDGESLFIYKKSCVDNFKRNLKSINSYLKNLTSISKIKSIMEEYNNENH